MNGPLGNMSLVGPVNPCFLVDTVEITAPADTAENTIKTIPIPAGMLGATGHIELAVIVETTNNVNAKTFKIKFDGQLLSYGISVSSSNGVRLCAFIQNISANSQVCFLSGSFTGSGTGNILTQLAVDTTLAKNITVTVQKANGADVVKTKSVVLKILRSYA